MRLIFGTSRDFSSNDRKLTLGRKRLFLTAFHLAATVAFLVPDLALGATVPDAIKGSWYYFGDDQTVGFRSIRIADEQIVVDWVERGVPCKVDEVREVPVEDPFTILLLSCDSPRAKLRLSLIGPFRGKLIMHFIGPGGDSLRVLMLTRGQQSAGAAPNTFLPQFPWPPPGWTGRSVLPKSLKLLRDKETLGDVFDRLTEAISRAGFVEWSVYGIGSDGFAIVAKLENIDDSGRPTAQRFQGRGLRPDVFSLSGYMDALLRARPGRYRVIALLVTSRPVTGSQSTPTPESLRKLLVQGAGILPKEMRATRILDSVSCEAIIYEFYRATEDEEPRLVTSSSLTPLDHLVGAKIWSKEALQ